MDHLKRSKGQFDEPCVLTLGAMEDLQYQLSEAELENGSSVTTEVMKYTACTDASQKMWRMSYGDIHIGGEWTKEELQIADSNINALELLAIEKTLFKLKKRNTAVDFSKIRQHHSGFLY